MNIIYLLLGLVFLITGGNWLLKAAVALSLRLNIPKIVIGMTVVSFATSAPELVVSVKSAVDGFPDIAVGNVVGSNIANIGLVLAFVILLSPIYVERSFYKTDWPVMMIASALFYGFIVFDGVLQRVEGIVLFSLLVLFLFYLLKFQKPAVIGDLIEDDKPLSLKRTMLFLLLGGVALWGGSELLVNGAVGLAKSFGVSDRVIAVTMISVGTSIPELAASLIAIAKKEKAISLGNLIGSNVFNILAVLGITAIITPITIQDQRLLTHDVYWMLGLSILIFPLVFLPKGLRLGWRDGLILITLYILFIYLAFP